MLERRRHKRVPIAGSTTLKYRNRESTPPVEAMVANISISGIGLYSDKHIEKNASVFLQVTFVSNDGNLYNESISGRIVYVNVIGGINYTGIEFNEMINPANQPHMHKHLMTVMKSSVNER